MGSSDSKDDKEEEKKVRIPADPLINRLRKTFRLELNSSKQRFTHSFLHSSFSQQIIKNKSGKVDQNFSPFCCITLPDPAEHILRVITCVMISPIMALAPSQHLCNQQGFFFRKNLTLYGLCKGSKLKINIKDVSSLPNVNLVLLMLEKPSWQLGWCGLSILEDSSQIKDLPIFCIKNTFNSGEPTIKDSEQQVIKQVIQKVYYEDIGNFKGKGSIEGENLLIQILQRKPYAIGVQKGNESTFFNEDILKDLQGRSKKYLTPVTESQILKEIDLQQMQIESSW